MFFVAKLSNKGEIIIENGIVRLIQKDQVALKSDVSSIYSNSEYEIELKLFNLLRQIRSEASKKFGQPANMICSDEILREIAHSHPSSYSELMEIKGFNQRMYNKIGEELLSVIKDSVDSDLIDKKLKEKNIPQNVIKILELVQKKYSLKDISSMTKLPESVVSIQIETLLGIVPELEIDSLFDKDELKDINKKISEGISDLKMLRESLNGKISYAKIRIALAKSRIN